jgi:hypothetical protein
MPGCAVMARASLDGCGHVKAQAVGALQADTIADSDSHTGADSELSCSDHHALSSADNPHSYRIAEAGALIPAVCTAIGLAE